VAGTTTAARGERQQESSGLPRLRRPKAPGPRTLVILASAALLAALGAGWLVYGSDWLRVHDVSVTGTRVLTPDQVREAADVPVGEPLMSVDTEAIEARLLSKTPRIDTVAVDRSWPDGVELKVTERTPVLLVRKGRNFMEVDDEGVRFAMVSRAPKGVPLLELALSGRGSSAASLRRFGEDRLVREAVRVAGRVPAAVARDATVVKVRSYDDISLELSGGRTVAWGSGEKGAEKARVLTALMKAEPGARYFDVSVPTAPASSGS
jgi:cell division protein FtsQ